MNYQVQVLMMAFQSLDHRSQENFIECLKEELKDEDFLKLLEERAKISKTLSAEETDNLRNYLKSPT